MFAPFSIHSPKNLATFGKKLKFGNMRKIKTFFVATIQRVKNKNWAAGISQFVFLEYIKPHVGMWFLVYVCTHVLFFFGKMERKKECVCVGGKEREREKERERCFHFSIQLRNASMFCSIIVLHLLTLQFVFWCFYS